MKNKKDENKETQYDEMLKNDTFDYGTAEEIIDVLINKHVPISERRANRILDMAKSMLPDVAHIYCK